MKEAKVQLHQHYPRTVTLANNSSVTLRLMTPFDGERILAFARSLPADDLLFLRTDITDPDVVAQWAQSVNAGFTITLIAQIRSEMAGYASLHHNAVTWQRHLGEIRIQVGPRYRSQGLGRILASEVFSIGRALGLRKIVAQMTADQKGAIATFERLGFQTEALLQDFVIDRRDRTRDLLVMSYDVIGFTTHVN
ncbi:MAG TPA: GNAT family N-acetyltransferase [Methylomirabilota bacterium]|jgi:L-amino acid N-acyltransferase YncA|nr:GNAT family N-acetyltransferase [Methylomirabilota bacterium]